MADAHRAALLQPRGGRIADQIFLEHKEPWLNPNPNPNPPPPKKKNRT